MGMLLIPVIVLAVLVVMAATVRSLRAGLVVGLLVVGVLAMTAGDDRSAAVAAGAVAGAGVVLGFAARGRLGGARALVLAALPLAAAFAASAFTSDRAVLEQELSRWVEREMGDALTPELAAEMTAWLLGLVPASAALISFLLVVVVYGVALRVLPRWGLEVRRLERFAALKLPFAVIWSFAAALLLCAVGQGLGERWLLILGVNLVLVHGAAFFAQGLAVGRETLTERAVPAGMQAVFALLAAVVMPLTIAVVVIGLLDQWFDFRRLLAPPREGPEDGGS
jgi:hypothetical protein